MLELETLVPIVTAVAFTCGIFFFKFSKMKATHETDDYQILNRLAVVFDMYHFSR